MKYIAYEILTLVAKHTTITLANQTVTGLTPSRLSNPVRVFLGYMFNIGKFSNIFFWNFFNFLFNFNFYFWIKMVPHKLF